MVLGTITISIFINNFSECSTFFKFTIFADDSTLSCKFNNTPADEINSILTTQLILINNWLPSNRIIINTNKSTFIVYSYRKNILIPPIKMSDNLIIQTTDQSFLVSLLINIQILKNILTMFPQKYQYQ